MKRLCVFFIMLSIAVSGQTFQQNMPAPRQEQLFSVLNDEICVAISEDGLTWEKDSRVLSTKASVPDVVRRSDGSLWCYFCDFSSFKGPGQENLGVLHSKNGLTWSERKIATIQGKTNKGGAVDPDVVELPDGRLRLYYFGSEVTSGNPGRQDGAHKIYSAISTDGINFVQEEGVRYEGERITDPDVVLFKGQWLMFVSKGREIIMAKSKDGLTFERVGTVGRDGAVTGSIALSDGSLRLYYSSGGGIRSMRTVDGTTWTQEEDFRIKEDNLAADPSVVKLSDGSYYMVYKKGNKTAPSGMNVGQQNQQQHGSHQQGPQQRPQNGPYQHVVLSASSKDGLTWTLDEGVRLEHASVPCAVVTPDNKIMLYYVDAERDEGPETANCAVSSDGIHFTEQDLTIEGMTSTKALDPSILLTKDGEYRLYYFAASMNFMRDRVHEIHLATSTDGIHFKERGKVFDYDGLVDPDVFVWKDKWHMYVFGEGGTVRAESNDGLQFTHVGVLELKDWGTTAPIVVGDQLRLYAFEQRRPSANNVASFVSQDAIHWKQESGVRLTAPAGKQYTDPSVVRWGNGYKMYFKQSASEERGGMPGVMQPRSQRL